MQLEEFGEERRESYNKALAPWREHFLTCAAEAVAAPTHISSES